MKKRKILIAIISVAVLIALGLTVYALSSSKENEPSGMHTSIKNEVEWKKGTLDKILSENENVPLSDLTEYVYDDTHRYHFFGRHYREVKLSGYRLDIRYFLGNIKIEHIYKFDSENFAVISKVKNKDVKSAYMVAIFSESVHYPEYKSSTRERWDISGEAYFIGDVYSFSDYGNVKVGDNVKTLCEIDDTINYDLIYRECSYKQWEEWMKDTDNFINTNWNEVEHTKMIYKLLKEGMMTVEYSSQTGIISSIDFYPYSEDMPLEYVTIKTDDFINYILNEG